MTDATLTAAEGVGQTVIEASLIGGARSLYLYVNKGVNVEVTSRSLYLYVNKGVNNSVLARSLYLYENLGTAPPAVPARSLYLYEATRDGEVMPWLMKINPTEQVRGGQVDLYGDGFGSVVEVAAGATISVDSVNASYVGANAVDRSTGSWVSNGNQSAAWIRFTFASPQTIVAIALESAGNGWGVPLFRFDAGVDVSGGIAVPAGVNAGSEYPVGTTRRLYTLPTPRTSSFLEVRVSGGGTTTFIGFYDVWIYADQDVAAEDSKAFLRTDEMGVVGWVNRSPGLYPANSGLPIEPAATVTVPATGESGLVKVVESS